MVQRGDEITIAGVDIKEGELMVPISCFKCRGILMFPAKLDRKEMVMKAKTRHGWTGSGRKIHCDGCSDVLDKSKPEKQAKAKVKNEPKDDTDEFIDLSEL